MDQSLAELVLKTAKASGASYAEARIEELKSSAFVLKNGVPHISGYDHSTGIAVRIRAGGAQSFGSTNILNEETVKRLVQTTVAAAMKSAQAAKPWYLAPASVEKGSTIVKQKLDVRDVSPSKKLQVLQDIEKAIKATKCRVPSRYFMLGDEHVEKLIINSEGTRIESSIPRTNFTYFTTIKQKGRSMQRYWQYGASGGFETVHEMHLPEVLAQEVKTLAKNMRIGVKPNKGIMDLVIGPQIAGIVAHESAGHPAEADRILGREAAQAGESYLKPSSLGMKAGSEAVTIIDEPSLPGSFGFYEFDDEGVRARKRYLYKKGIIAEFLHNRESAATFNVNSNASARSSGFDREPLVRMANTYFEPGKSTEKELIEGVRKGIFLKTFMEWNIDDLRFNQKYVGAEAYHIENGKITKPVLEPVLEITTPKLYGAIDALANNMEFHSGSCGKGEPMQGMPVWFGGPSLRMRDVRIGGP